MIDSDKRQLRKKILAIRDAQPLELRQNLSFAILRKVYELDVFKEAGVILTYADYRSEVITIPLIDKALADKKQVFCPRVIGKDMDFYRIYATEDLNEGYKGIREPVSGERFDDGDKTARCLMIMPGAVFDKKCGRIGYGGGFYDRYLSKMSENETGVKTLALAYECQLADSVPVEAHDIRPDMLVTENEIYYSLQKE